MPLLPHFDGGYTSSSGITYSGYIDREPVVALHDRDYDGGLIALEVGENLPAFGQLAASYNVKSWRISVTATSGSASISLNKVVFTGATRSINVSKGEDEQTAGDDGDGNQIFYNRTDMFLYGRKNSPLGEGSPSTVLNWNIGYPGLIGPPNEAPFTQAIVQITVPQNNSYLSSSGSLYHDFGAWGYIELAYFDEDEFDEIVESDTAKIYPAYSAEYPDSGVVGTFDKTSVEFGGKGLGARPRIDDSTSGATWSVSIAPEEGWSDWTTKQVY
jgi:hypothetical protein